MKYHRAVLVTLLVLTVFALAACKPSEPPSEAVLTELLNQRDGVQGQYTFQGMMECLPTQEGIVADWEVRYTRVDIEGGETQRVHALQDEEGEWSIVIQDFCAVR